MFPMHNVVPKRELSIDGTINLPGRNAATVIGYHPSGAPSGVPMVVLDVRADPLWRYARRLAGSGRRDRPAATDRTARTGKNNRRKCREFAYSDMLTKGHCSHAAVK